MGTRSGRPPRPAANAAAEEAGRECRFTSDQRSLAMEHLAVSGSRTRVIGLGNPIVGDAGVGWRVPTWLKQRA